MEISKAEKLIIQGVQHQERGKIYMFNYKNVGLFLSLGYLLWKKGTNARRSLKW